MKPTAARVREMRMPALAITDTNNMCGALEFSDTLVGLGIQPIIGLTLSLDLEIDDQPGQLRKDPDGTCLLYTSPSPRDKRQSRMPSSA